MQKLENEYKMFPDGIENFQPEDYHFGKIIISDETVSQS